MASPTLVPDVAADCRAPSEPRSTSSPDDADCGRASTAKDHAGLLVAGAPAMVTWASEDNPESNNSLWSSGHDQICLRLHYDPPSNAAFCQLRATNMAFKGRKDKVSVFLSIHWERIQSLALARNEDNDDALLAATRLGTGVVGLHFRLNRPPALIVPKGDCTPRQKATGVVLDSLRSLAMETDFAIYLPATEASKAGLESLCQAASAARVRSMDRLYDVASLYGGKGGHVTQHGPRSGEGGGLSAAAHQLPPPPAQDDEEPPSYEEAGPSAGPRHAAHRSQKRGAKRRRMSSGSASGAGPSSHKCESTAAMEAMCSRILQRLDQGFSQLQSRVGSIEQRLADLEATVHSRADQLEQGASRSSKETEELRHDLEQGLDDVRQELDDIVSVRIEDEVYTVQQNLDEHIRDAMMEATDTVEERVVERLSTANVSISFG